MEVVEHLGLHMVSVLFSVIVIHCCCFHNYTDQCMYSTDVNTTTRETKERMGIDIRNDVKKFKSKELD